MLATHGWQKIIDETEAEADTSLDYEDASESPLIAIDRLVEHFTIPLEGAGVILTDIKGEFEAMMAYASQFISISTLDYQSVWWRLFYSPNNAEWSSALMLARLLFSLPSSNGKVERTFSQLNLLKTSKRASLGKQAVDDLLTINVCKVSMDEFKPEPAINLWWEDKLRRPNQTTRKEYKRINSSAQEIETENDSGSDEEQLLMLNDWDEWMNF